MNDKKRILFIVENYFLPGGHTNCCKNVINFFKKEGCCIDILTQNANSSNSTLVEKGVNIIGFESFRDKYDNRKGNGGIIKKLEYLIRRGKSFFNPLSYSKSSQDVSYLRIKKLLKKLHKIVLQHGKYDCIISFSSMFQMHVLANLLMKKKIANKWIVVAYDPFVYEEVFVKFSKVNTEKRKKVAEKTLKDAFAIFTIKGYMDKNIENGYNPEYHKKIIEIYPTALLNMGDNEKAIVSDRINMIYAGNFYSEIRNPSEMLDVLALFPKEFSISFYTNNNCEWVFNEKRVFFKNSELIVNPLINSELLQEKIKNSDILLSLGNKVSQIPSKVLEYMSFGKPIVHFCFNRKDIVVEILKDYPLSYILNLSNYTQADVVELIDFCKKNKNSTLSYDEIYATCAKYTNEDICKKILEKVNVEL